MLTSLCRLNMGLIAFCVEVPYISLYLHVNGGKDVGPPGLLWHTTK